MTRASAEICEGWRGAELLAKETSGKCMHNGVVKPVTTKTKGIVVGCIAVIVTTMSIKLLLRRHSPSLSAASASETEAASEINQ